MGLNDDVTWIWPNMVNLNVINFSKWYEMDCGLKKMNEMDYGLKEIKMKYDQWKY